VTESVDVVLIGGGIMSATLGTLLRELQPDWKVVAFERLSDVAEESSNAWNNAGTGHAALCELNYMPEGKDGSLDPGKAIGINEQVRVEVLGTQAIFDSDAQQRRPDVVFPSDGEYRVRAAVRSVERRVAQRVSDEVLSLYCSGPAAGAGVRQHVTAQVSTASILVDRARVQPKITLVEAP